MNFKKYCRGVISPRAVQSILQETNDHELLYLSFSSNMHVELTHYLLGLMLGLPWLLAPAKEVTGMSSSDFAASVGSSSETSFIMHLRYHCFIPHPN